MHRFILFICLCVILIVKGEFISYSEEYDNNRKNENSFSVYESGNYKEKLDYDAIQKVIDDARIRGFDFEREVNDVIKSGDIEYGKWFDNIKDKFILQLKSKKKMFVKIIFLILFSAIFTSFTRAIDNDYIVILITNNISKTRILHRLSEIIM